MARHDGEGGRVIGVESRIASVLRHDLVGAGSELCGDAGRSGNQVHIAQEARAILEGDLARGRTGLTEARRHPGSERDRLICLWTCGTARQRNMVAALIVENSEARLGE